MVIQAFLNGKKRDIIAKENNISTGLVSGIIKNWKEKIKICDIDELRRFAKMVNKSGITIEQCARGYRTIQTIESLGLTHDEYFHSFIDNIYKICINNKITPDFIEKLISDITNFFISSNHQNFVEDNSYLKKENYLGNIPTANASIIQKDNEIPIQSITNKIYPKENKKSHNTTNSSSNSKYLTDNVNSSKPSLSEISHYIRQLREEKTILEEKIDELNNIIIGLNEKVEQINYKIQDLFQKEKTDESLIKWFIQLKKQLFERYSINLFDLELFSKVIINIKNLGFNENEIINRFFKILSLEATIKNLNDEINIMSNNLNAIRNEYSTTKSLVDINSITLDAYKQLEVMGFGLEELKHLWLTITEITKAKHIPHETAIQIFIKDVEDNYYNKIDFEKKAEEKRSELHSILDQINIQRIILSNIPFMGQKMAYLLQNGIDEIDILNIHKLITNQMNIYHYRNGKSSNNINDNQGKFTNQNNSNIPKPKFYDMLISDINKYHELRYAIISLSKNLDKIKQQISNMIKQRDKLSTLYSKDLNVFLQHTAMTSTKFIMFFK